MAQDNSAQGTVLLLSNANSVDPDKQEVNRGHILIENGRIHAVLQDFASNYSGAVIDVAN